MLTYPKRFDSIDIKFIEENMLKFLFKITMNSHTIIKFPYDSDLFKDDTELNRLKYEITMIEFFRLYFLVLKLEYQKLYLEKQRNKSEMTILQIINSSTLETISRALLIINDVTSYLRYLTHLKCEKCKIFFELTGSASIIHKIDPFSIEFIKE